MISREEERQRLLADAPPFDQQQVSREWDAMIAEAKLVLTDELIREALRRAKKSNANGSDAAETRAFTATGYVDPWGLPSGTLTVTDHATVNFTAGQTTATLTINPIDDLDTE